MTRASSFGFVNHFAPVGDMVLPALASLVPGGTLALAGIHMTDIPTMNYQKEIFHEKTLTSVESNTRRDGEEFLTLADRLNIHPEVHEYPLAKADEALRYVKHGDIKELVYYVLVRTNNCLFLLIPAKMVREV